MAYLVYRSKQANLKMTNEDFGPENYIPSNNTVTGIATGTLPTKLLRDTNIVDLVRTRETLTTGDFDNLKQDIKEKGIQTPLTIAIEKDNTITIIDGTHRLLAAEELGIQEVPVDVRFFGGVNKTHPEVLKNVEIKNMSRQPIEIIKENKEARNLLKSLDKISYTMEDALNTELKFTKLKKADIVEDYLQHTGRYKYNVICYDAQGNEKETKQFKDKHLAWIYGEYWKDSEEGNTYEIIDITTKQQVRGKYKHVNTSGEKFALNKLRD